ncbi:hypothetical protein O9992_29815 [Vibrio lentus]|nr:hypothetical protein [Vibrio lentus]
MSASPLAGEPRITENIPSEVCCTFTFIPTDNMANLLFKCGFAAFVLLVRKVLLVSVKYTEPVYGFYRNDYLDDLLRVTHVGCSSCI